MPAIKDITGEKYNYLTVIEYIGRENKRTFWKCRCDCGNEIIVRADHLKTGNTKSCGCFQIKNRYNNTFHKKHNTFITKGNVTEGFTTNGYKFIIDTEDLPKIKNICWFKGKGGYLEGRDKNIKYKMHRLITNCPKGLDVDHINHCVNDNRKTNLRVCTRSQNNMNHRNRKPTAKGLHWYKARSKWAVSISKDHKNYFLGYYDNYEDALEVRRRAEKEYFKEFAYKEKENESRT